MEKNLTEIICGTGRGKTSLAIGKCLRASSKGKSVIIIQFLKGKEKGDTEFLEDLDNHDIKIFRFEKQEAHYNDLGEEEKKEERTNILNGLNFARKVIVTRECDVLVLDEVLGLLEMGIASEEMMRDVLDQIEGSMHVILTGVKVPEWLMHYADSITTVTTTDIIST